MIIFRILIVIALIFYAFSLIVKLIFNHKIKRLKRQAEAFTQNDAQQNTDEAKNPHIDPNIGEYTDFEEVE
jgi:hypothetical protein